MTISEVRSQTARTQMSLGGRHECPRHGGAEWRREIEPDTTVLITTRNRCAELRRALESVLAQDVSCRVLVFDDGSSDGTSEMVRREFPAVRLVRVEASLGIVAARNTAIRLCDTNFVVTIDDDCVIESPATIRQTLANFDHPLVAAVAIPYYTPARSAPALPHGDRTVVPEFTGCSNALRRDVFIRLGGFRADLWRQTEEYDFCTRLLEAGYLVRRGDAAPILHCESPLRDGRSIMFYSVRNHIIYAWTHVPGWRMPLHLLVTTYNAVRGTFRRGMFRPAFAGIASAVKFLLRHPYRNPVSLRSYRLMRQLRKNRGLSMEDALSRLART